MNKPLVQLLDLGLIDYAQCWDYQEQLFREKLEIKSWNKLNPNQTKSIGHHLLFVEHPPVYTLGKSGDASHLLIDEEEQNQLGISFFRINRGGDITFHGPGQLVVYPILDLEQMKTDIHWYMRQLEEVVIRTIGHFGLNGERYPGFTGVWLSPNSPSDARKICAMGVRTSRWVTMHGLALNNTTDLSFFDRMIPCGIKDKQVTSIHQELGQAPDITVLKQIFKQKFSDVFEIEWIENHH